MRAYDLFDPNLSPHNPGHPHHSGAVHRGLNMRDFT